MTSLQENKTLAWHLAKIPAAGGPLEPGAVQAATTLIPKAGFPGGSAMIVVSATTQGSTWELTQELGRAFHHVLEKPVLVFSLNPPGVKDSDERVLLYRLSEEADVELSVDPFDPELREGSGLVLARLTAEDEDLLKIVSSGKFRRFLALLKSRFGAILIAGPPLSTAPETFLLAQISDGVILAVREGQTRVREVTASQTLAARINARILGFVLDSTARRPSRKVKC